MADCANSSAFNGTPSFDSGKNDGVNHFHGWWFVAPMATILALVSVASVVGNILVVATIARHRGMRTRTNLLLANLAAADILVGALDMPFSLVALVKGRWVFGEGACQFNAFTTGLALMASIHTLMFISIHKYISMTRPFSRAMTPLRISLMACAVWAWSFLYNLSPFFGITCNVYKKGATQCGPIIPTTVPQKVHSFVNTFMNFLLPLCVMFFCNFQISRAVSEHMGRMRQTSNMNYRNSVLQQKHITVTLVIVMVCFLTCWTPYIIYSCMLVFSKNKDIVPLIFNPIVYWCGYLNSACNPIIYAFRSPSFRQGYLEILCRSKGDTRVGSFYSGSSIKHFTRNHSDRIHAPNFNGSKVEKGSAWSAGGGRSSKGCKQQQRDTTIQRDVIFQHQLMPNSDAASRTVLQRLVRRSLAQGIVKAYPTRSSPDLRDVQDNTCMLVKKRALRRCDSDSCLAMALLPPETPSETRVCSFHTISDEDEAHTGSNQEIVKVIITQAEDDDNSTITTPCLRTESAYVIAIEGDHSIQNTMSVQVVVTDADAMSNHSTPTHSIICTKSNNSIAQSFTENNAKSSPLSPRKRPSSLLPVGNKDLSLRSLQDIKCYKNDSARTGSGNLDEGRKRGRRHTEAVNRFIPAPKSDTKFHSDPGGLAPKRLGSVERLNIRKLAAPRVKATPTNTPVLRNLPPKWRLSVEGLDKNASSSAKNTGLRGSIMALLGIGQTNS